jgi:hypothetical protein
MILISPARADPESSPFKPINADIPLDASLERMVASAAMSCPTIPDPWLDQSHGHPLPRRPFLAVSRLPGPAA